MFRRTKSKAWSRQPIFHSIRTRLGTKDEKSGKTIGRAYKAAGWENLIGYNAIARVMMGAALRLNSTPGPPLSIKEEVQVRPRAGPPAWVPERTHPIASHEVLSFSPNFLDKTVGNLERTGLGEAPIGPALSYHWTKSLWHRARTREEKHRFLKGIIDRVRRKVLSLFKNRSDGCLSIYSGFSNK
jgi:hypothetical protein